LTLLSVAYGEKISLAVLGSLRRVAKHWQGGDKCLAAIHLAQMGLPDIGEDAAYRLSLAAELLDAGVTPRELARELGFDPPAGLVKYSYNPDEPRVPAGSGYGSGEWTFADAAVTPLTEGRSASANADDINHMNDLPKDAVVVTRPDGTTIDDPSSPTKKLMAPQRANFQEVYAASKQLAANHFWQDVVPAYEALHHFGTYDFQRDKATHTHFKDYVNAANYAVGVYMVGVGYGKWESVKIAQTYGFLFSSKKYDDNARDWTEKGWDDADQGKWQ
jgi:hypothetical protein